MAAGSSESASTISIDFRSLVIHHRIGGFNSSNPCRGPLENHHYRPIPSGQCQGDGAACCGGWILITWCLARTVDAAFGLAFMRFVGTGCEGPAGVT